MPMMIIFALSVCLCFAINAAVSAFAVGKLKHIRYILVI